MCFLLARRIVVGRAAPVERRVSVHSCCESTATARVRARMIVAMTVIRIVTFAELLEHGYELACWCAGCHRWATTDLALLVQEGLGRRFIQRCKPRCRKCGQQGQWQVRPSVPTLAQRH